MLNILFIFVKVFKKQSPLNLGIQIFKYRFYLFFTFCCLACLCLQAQANNENPFELTPRLPKVVQKDTLPAAEVIKKPANPFDIVANPAPKEQKNNFFVPPKEPKVIKPDAAQVDNNKARFRFGLVVFILTILAFLLTILRQLTGKSFQAFLSTNMMNQLFREQEGRGIFPFLLLYLMFMINLGIFIFLSVELFGITLHESQIISLLYCIGGVITLYLCKHLLLGYIGAIFPVKKEISKYNFTIIIFGIVIGLFLVPSNLLLTFGPENLSKPFIYLTAGIIGLIYIYRYFRSLSFASKFVVFHKFHFLLYICTIELTPAIIILKLVLDGF